MTARSDCRQHAGEDLEPEISSAYASSCGGSGRPGREGWVRRFFERWRAALKWQRLGPYEKFAGMIERHWEGIAAYCRPENTVALGFVEGLNNKIRVLQRRAYGLCDEEQLLGPVPDRRGPTAAPRRRQSASCRRDCRPGSRAAPASPCHSADRPRAAPRARGRCAGRRRRDRAPGAVCGRTSPAAPGRRFRRRFF